MADRAAMIEQEVGHLRRFALALTGDRDLADDLVQDTVERALSRWALRRRDRPLRPWLFTILRNLFVSGRRRAGLSRAALERGGASGIFWAEERAAPDAEAGVELKRVLALLRELPEEQREAILLVSVEGFSYQEAADIAGAPIGTVMSRLSRGRARLRELTAPPVGARLRSVK